MWDENGMSIGSDGLGGVGCDALGEQHASMIMERVLE
jgi:hypothetical protein